MGFAHGSNDAQKTMGIIALTLVAAQADGTSTTSLLAGVSASIARRLTITTSTPGSRWRAPW
jgi:phosphate/sulfate permease